MNDPASRATFKCRDEFQSEFPQCDPRYIDREYRHGWYTSSDERVKSSSNDGGNFFNVIGHFDHQTGAADRYYCEKAMTSEAIFVPKSATAAEWEGYLLSVVTSFETRTSSLIV